MVDTLVLGTSANAWEFESLHAQTKRMVAQTKRMVNIYHPFSFHTSGKKFFQVFLNNYDTKNFKFKTGNSCYKTI